MRYYVVFYDDKIQTFGILEKGQNLSTNNRVEWFESEKELEVYVDGLKGDGYYQSQMKENDV